MDVKVTGMLLRTIINNVNSYISEQLKEFGIGHGQFEYLMLINQYEGLTQNEIAKIKSVTKASVTKAVNILEKDNFVIRKVDPEDKRAVKLYCTDKTNEIISNLEEYREEVERKVFKDFSNDEKEMLLNLLTKLKDNTELLKGGKDG